VTIRYQPVSYAKFNPLLNTPELEEVLRQIAEKGMAYAVSISPEHTGEYKASFSVETGVHGGPHGDRAEAQIVNSSDHAVNVEWQDNYHVLSRTAAQLGE
jgi:hypothetical protein